jgi:cyclic lactone autoinducer peptide
MKKRAFYKLATLLGFIAVIIATTTASWLYIHQDETPAELLK